MFGFKSNIGNREREKFMKLSAINGINQSTSGIPNYLQTRETSGNLLQNTYTASDVFVKTSSPSFGLFRRRAGHYGLPYPIRTTYAQKLFPKADPIPSSVGLIDAPAYVAKKAAAAANKAPKIQP